MKMNRKKTSPFGAGSSRTHSIEQVIAELDMLINNLSNLCESTAMENRSGLANLKRSLGYAKRVRELVRKIDGGRYQFKDFIVTASFVMKLVEWIRSFLDLIIYLLGVYEYRENNIITKESGWINPRGIVKNTWYNESVSVAS